MPDDSPSPLVALQLFNSYNGTTRFLVGVAVAYSTYTHTYVHVMFFSLRKIDFIRTDGKQRVMGRDVGVVWW